MKKIRPTNNKHHWPRDSVECRERDLVIRITDWTDDKDEPAFDVEVYIGGVYDWNESKVFSTKNSQAKQDAINFAQEQIKKLL